jgi:hypothetical protein
MKLCLPKRKSAVERLLLLAVLLSPVFVTAHFLFRLASNAYPPEADSIGIPIFAYLIFPYPLFVLLAFKGRNGLASHDLHVFWNPKRFGNSLLWTLLCIYPIGLFMTFILLDAIDAISIPSCAYSLILWIALGVYRSGAISRPRCPKTPV